MTTRDANVSELGRVVPGGVYRWAGAAKAGGTLYRVLGVGTALHAYSEVVIYEGLDGADLGRLWTCSLADFALRFTPERLPEAEVPRVGGGRGVTRLASGSGY